MAGKLPSSACILGRMAADCALEPAAGAWLVGRRRHHGERIPAGPQGRDQADRGCEQSALWPDHRLCGNSSDRAGANTSNTQNCGMGDFDKDLCLWRRGEGGAEFRSAGDRLDGIRRPTGRRDPKTISAILTSVNCSAHVAAWLPTYFEKNVHRRQSDGRFPKSMAWWR